jgi:hypothetical protein
VGANARKGTPLSEGAAFFLCPEVNRPPPDFRLRRQHAMKPFVPTHNRRNTYTDLMAY